MIQKLMTLTAAVVASVSASTAEAYTIANIDLDLRLEKTGYEILKIYNDRDEVLYEYSFLDSLDNSWGIRPVHDLGYSIGQAYSFSASFGAEQVSNCYLGSRSCTGAFGSTGEGFFSMGDAQALTSFPDFYLRGGTSVGDEVTLSTFEPVYYFDSVDDDKYAVWSGDALVFSVVRNNITPVPLPAGLPLLFAAFGGLGLMARRKRKAT